VYVEAESIPQHRRLEEPRATGRPGRDHAPLAVPTTLIWGRDEPGGTAECLAEAASARHGLPLHVIESARDDPAIEQRGAFLEALRTALASCGGKS
jgi:pimeloyl-ACP methyl ester carboxylesterase